MDEQLKNLMIKAIEEERHPKILPFCRQIWNQPFFYKLDKAKALTISYSPTDKGARTNYPHLLERYKKGQLTIEEIFNTLYNFKEEPHWRRNFNIIFDQLGISSFEISHMDMSSFPYDKDTYRRIFSDLDNSFKYPLKVIELLSKQLKYILIDGKDNKEILKRFFSKEFTLYKQTKLPINKSGHLYELSIYKHKIENITLIYYGCFLFGQTMPRTECILDIASYLKENI